MQRLWLFISVVTMSSLKGMLYDNRFWPIYPEPFLSRQAYPATSWFLGMRGIFVGADHCYTQDDSEKDLFSITGIYDELTIDTALQKIGIIPQSLIRPDLQSLGTITWASPGKISLRGGTLETQIYLCDWFSWGGSLFVGEEESHQQSILSPTVRGTVSLADAEELIAVNTQLLELLNINPFSYRGVVFGDIDLHLGFHARARYWFKIHELDAEFRFGIYAPSSQPWSVANPAALPIGGDGHTGIYGQSNMYLLLNDDISAGWALQVCKRLPRTALHRMPLLTEPILYGSLVGCARVNPGLTVAFNPYVQYGGLRQGFGLALGYYLVHHAQDTWTANQLPNPALQPNIKLLQDNSTWGSDHFSISAFYDFGYEREGACHAPLISLTVDIPWKGPVTYQVTKAHTISLRIELRL